MRAGRLCGSSISDELDQAVGCHGHGELTGMLLGSVSMHCMTHATCPVVVVRREE
jgi:hypothetical protein